MTSRRLISRRYRGSVRSMLRELLICVALPSVLLVTAGVVAQKTSPYQPQQQRQSDNQIAANINNRLMDSNQLRPLDLGVWVHNGTATLSGTVPTPDLRQQANALVRDVPGVIAVDDRLRIGEVSATAPGFANRQNSPPQHSDEIAPPPPENYPAGPGNEPDAGSPNEPYQETMQNQMAPPQQGNGSPADQPMVTIPPRTPISVMIEQTIDSRHTQPGTRFRGVLVRDVVLRYGIIALPRGAYVDGTIIDARPSGHLKGHPQLALQLSNVEVGDTSYVLTSDVWARRGPGKGGATAQTVTGSAAFGAITGGIVGGGPTALLGAALGGLGGAGLSALSPGARLIVPAESVITFNLNAPLTVREPTLDEIHALAANAPAPGYGQPGYGQRRRPYYRGYPPPPSPPMPGAPPGGYPY